jgi:hypothetical protein
MLHAPTVTQDTDDTLTEAAILRRALLAASAGLAAKRAYRLDV